MNTTHFTIPVSFAPAETTPSGKNPISDALNSACIRSEPSSLVSWGFAPQNDSDSEDSGIKKGRPPCGVVMGCADGTLYLFHPPPGSKLDLLSPVRMNIDIMGNTSPSSSQGNLRLGHAQSRSSSRSSVRSPTLSLFHVSKSRIVSGLSVEQAEAPKNFVDFDDEPDKLKDMLRGRGSAKEKTVMDGLLPTFDKGVVLDKSEISSPTHAAPLPKRKDDLRPNRFTGAASPSLKSPTPTSVPPSPMMLPTSVRQTSNNPYSLSLKCHIFPPKFGPGRGIVQTTLLGRDKYAVSLQAHGDVSVFDVCTGSCLANTQHRSRALVPPAGTPDPDSLFIAWFWTAVHVVEIGETALIMACASSDFHSSRGVSLDSDPQEKTRLAFYQFTAGKSTEAILEKVGEWYFEGCVEGASLHVGKDGSIKLQYVDALSRLIVYPIRLSVPLSSGSINRRSSTSSNSGLPNPFKVLKSLSEDPAPVVEDHRETGRIEVGKKNDFGTVSMQGSISGTRKYVAAESQAMRTAIWSNEELLILESNGEVTTERSRVLLLGILDLQWISYSSIAVQFSDKCEIYALSPVDANNDVVRDKNNVETNLQLVLVKSTTVAGSDASCFTPAGDLILTRRDNPDSRKLEITLSSIQDGVQTFLESLSRKMWTADETDAKSEPYVSTSLPEGMDSVILGCSDGHLRRVSWANISAGKSFTACSTTSNIPLNGYITSLHCVGDSRTKESLLVGGADDGSLAFWSSSSLQMYLRWTIFLTPLAHVLHLKDDRVGRLKGSVLCIAQDGTIAVIAIDDIQFLCLIPASMSPLTRVCVGGDNLLLIYEDRHARLWDIRTKEFWRSMITTKADELLKQGGWAEWPIETLAYTQPGTVSHLSSTLQTYDSASTLLFDLENFLKSVRPITNQEEKQVSVNSDRLRVTLSMLLTPGLHPGIDGICKDRLRIPVSNVSVGVSRSGWTCSYPAEAPQSCWSVAPEVSASRALAIVACLQALSANPEFSEDASTVMTFYTASVGQVVGELYETPSLAYLARSWFQFSDEFREPIKILFNAGVARLSDEDSTLLAENWQHHLPCLQPDAQKESVTAATAIFICGSIAVEKYSLLSPSLLTDISKSIAMYLHDELSLYRVLAIDLCSRGFDIWQQYVDVMEMLRALFALSTHVKKDSINTVNVGSHARLAILQIASSNTPLFMTTLSMDIMNPKSLQHQKSIMQMVAFLIRKKPLVIYPNLPRLVEAVVKSLDPNSSGSRESTLDAATEILGHVVLTFPTVDFHMASQRLAVGTSEGAIIMFDLKTATRLYVLEGHKKRLAACSFSPDGRRLVTVSLDESVVLVWKVGTSLSSFFNPGAPPRQGNSGSEPFKTLDFNVGDAGAMSLAATFEHVKFEWPADRSVRLKIRETILTFST